MTQSVEGDPTAGLDGDVPTHVAIIMDGNGRWAAERGLERVAGHQEGAKSVRRVLEESRRLGIRYITLYAFSSENWERPVSEVEALMDLFAHYLEKERETFLSEDIRLRAIGDRSRLPKNVCDRLESLEQDTSHCQSMDLILAVSYGGRDELVRAAAKYASDVLKNGLTPSELTQEQFSSYLDTKDVPDPDLLIRTSGESRISNFLLWQVAYAEIVMTDVFWPDFSKAEYVRCLKEFAKRERRFGRSDGCLYVRH